MWEAFVMLRLQQIKLSHKNQFLTKLLVCSWVFHGFVCFGLFFLYTSYDQQALLEISTRASEAIVQFVAFEQPVQKAAVTTTQLVRTAPKKSTALAAQKKQPVKKETKLQPKAPVKKPEPVKKDLSGKVQKAKTDAVQKPVEQTQKAQEVNYVSRKEYDTVMLESSLQEAILQVWAPPAGMQESLVCNVTLTVDWHGKLVESVVEESSGVLVYDIAVEQAIAQLDVPRQLWGKTVRVAFKP